MSRTMAQPVAPQSPNIHRTIRASLAYPPLIANDSSFQNLSAAALSGKPVSPIGEAQSAN